MSPGPQGAASRTRALLPSGQPRPPRQATLARRTAAIAAQARRPRSGPEPTEGRPDGEHPDGAPPGWVEADSFRETTLRFIDDLKVRETVRAFGWVLFDMAVALSRDLGDESETRIELRAILADLRYTAGCCSMVGHSAVSCSLDAADEKLARFARKVARRLGALIEAIEEELSYDPSTEEGARQGRPDGG